MGKYNPERLSDELLNTHILDLTLPLFFPQPQPTEAQNKQRGPLNGV